GCFLRPRSLPRLGMGPRPRLCLRRRSSPRLVLALQRPPRTLRPRRIFRRALARAGDCRAPENSLEDGAKATDFASSFFAWFRDCREKIASRAASKHAAQTDR